MKSMIFPTWVIVYFPPLILIVMGLNTFLDLMIFAIGGLMLRGGLDLTTASYWLRTLWRSIMIGLLVDFVIALYLTFWLLISDFLPHENYSDALLSNPYKNFVATVVVCSGIVIAIAMIYQLNTKWAFSEMINPQASHIMAMLLAVIGSPWYYLIPSQIFYKS